MRLLHVLGSLDRGGAERLCCDLACEQAKRGHQVTVAIMAEAPVGTPRRALSDSVKEELEQSGVTVVLIGAGARDVLGAARGLRTQARGTRVEVAHVHLAAGLLAVTAALPRRTPLVWTLHNTDFGFPRRAIRLAVPLVGRFVGCSPAVAEVFEPYLVKKLVMIPNGIPLSRFRASGPRTVGSEMRLLGVGGMRAQKNYPRMVAAVATANRLLAGSPSKVTLAIAGDGPERVSIEAAIRDEGATGFVELLGERNDVPDLLQDHDAFIMSSNHEGLPISLLEAMAAGLPCIATPFPAATDLLAPDHVGLVAADFTPHALSQCIVELARDPQLRQDLSVRSQLLAAQYDLSACADRYEELYAEVAGSS